MWPWRLTPATFSGVSSAQNSPKAKAPQKTPRKLGVGHGTISSFHGGEPWIGGGSHSEWDPYQGCWYQQPWQEWYRRCHFFQDIFGILSIPDRCVWDEFLGVKCMLSAFIFSALAALNVKGGAQNIHQRGQKGEPSSMPGAALAACGMAAAAGVRRAARNQRRNQQANMAGNFEQMLGLKKHIIWIH